MVDKDNHLKLATFIKNVHEDLRKQSHLVGEDIAWRSHCTDVYKLKQYASAMKELSSVFWENNFLNNSKAISRIHWINETIINYFSENLEYFRKKEEDVIKKNNICINNIKRELFTEKWKLLDVGSCYNPFTAFEHFEVTAIDIAPATNEVFTCDFLNVQIDNKESKHSADCIISFKRNSFDIVVFSLLLEYLPSPKQRFECCKQAYEVLKKEGLLIIITPDSKHVGANAKLMKSWRFILANIGFSRVKYEKLPHIHCMAFRKSFDKQITLNWVKIYEKQQTFKEMFIPQDFKASEKNYNIQLNNDIENRRDLNGMINLFSELPNDC